MKVQFTPQLSAFNHYSNQKLNKKNNTTTTQYSYNPAAYQDYNISFGARLLRTPENFYEQDFNEQNMPKSLHKYIYESPDSDFKKTIPPAQAMKEVFGKINYAKDLDAVKKMFPDEPLFADLTSTPNKKSREGLLGMINLIKDDPSYEGKTLFKNGNNDLGLYILKKIYIEGKTLKEINKDFSKDVSVYFKSYGIKPQDYNAFGIKFPNNSFWHSFIVTREDFPYVYIPRASQSGISVNRGSGSSYVAPKPVKKNKFDEVKDWEVEKLADALIKGNGSKSETEKQIRKRGVQNKESMNFVAQYMGEINSVVLEKLHISDDMKDYFENYNDLTKTQREKFDEYMKNPYINDLRSKVMSSTIRLFFDVYGVDGNNEDFKELIEYAHNIKPNRIARNEEHDRLQAEYEATLGIFEESQDTAPVIEDEYDEETAKLKEFQRRIDSMGPESESYEFKTKDSPIVIYTTPKILLEEGLKSNTILMPKAYANKFLNFAHEHPLNTEAYRFALIAQNPALEIIPDDRFMSIKDAEKNSQKIYRDFIRNNMNEDNAAQQAMIDLYINATGNDHLPNTIFQLTSFGLGELFMQLEPEHKEFLLKNKDLTDKKFNEYRKPLTTSEINKITNEMIRLIREYDKNSSIVQSGTIIEGLDDVIMCLKIALNGQNKREYKDCLKKEFAGFLKTYGGSAKFLLDDKTPETYKMAKLEHVLSMFTSKKAGVLTGYIKYNQESMEYLRTHNIILYTNIKN